MTYEFAVFQWFEDQERGTMVNLTNSEPVDVEENEYETPDMLDALARLSIEGWHIVGTRERVFSGAYQGYETRDTCVEVWLQRERITK